MAINPRKSWIFASSSPVSALELRRAGGNLVGMMFFMGLPWETWVMRWKSAVPAEKKGKMCFDTG